MSSKIRRATLALTMLAAPVGLAAASPASADTILPRLSTGGCITGIADTYDGQPVCRVIGTDDNRTTIFTVGPRGW